MLGVDKRPLSAYTEAMEDPAAIQLDRRGVPTHTYMIFSSICDAGHVHVRGGYVSRAPVLPGEDYEDEKIMVHGTTGEIFRTTSDLVFSLN